MKRIFLAIYTILISIYAGFAADAFYMAPYGAVNINLDAPEAWKTERTVPSGEVTTTTIFDDGQIVIVGGLEGLTIDPLSNLFGTSEVTNYKIELSFSSDSYDPNTQYFYFTKQSDPAFRRPFQIQAISRITRSGIANPSYFYTNHGLINGEGTNEISASENSSFLRDGLEALINGLTGDDWSLEYDGTYEFAIILPGSIENGVLEAGGVPWSVATGTDYSAEIEVTARVVNEGWGDATVNGMTNPEIKFTIPFSGYYDPRYGNGEEMPGMDTSASLFVIPNARAANIDLLNDQGKTDIPIADVDFSLFGLSSDATYDSGDVFLFLSSSSNPFDSSASEFRFVHKDVGFGEAITDSNSIGYKIRAVPDFDAMKSADSIEGITEVTYYGADYLTADGIYPDENQRMHTACYKEELGDMFGGGSVHWHSYSGTLYLELDTNNVIMDEGLYRSTVYVHVVTDENISKRGEVTA